MRITGWTYAEDNRYEEMFDGAQQEYCGKSHDDIILIIAKELKGNNYRFDGRYHQNGDYGVPVFENKWKYVCTFRTWGKIMAKAYPEEIDNTDGFGYVKWAWSVPEGKIASVPRTNNV